MPVELRPVASVRPCDKNPRSIISPLTPSPRILRCHPNSNSESKAPWARSERADSFAILSMPPSMESPLAHF
jgi:hypothetical protein